MATAGVIFVIQRLIDYSAEIDFSRLDSAVWATLLILILISTTANLMLALAWWNLLKQLGVHVPRRLAVKIYGITQLAKYVPGNIFHHASRQAKGLAEGMSGWPLAKSAAWELGLIIVSFGLFGLLALPLLAPGLSVGVNAGVFMAAMYIVAVLLWRFTGLPVARAFGWYSGFLVISGLLFITLIKVLVKTHGTGADFWLPLGGAYALALLAGLVTPGAPAGVGVRELVLMFLLKAMVDETDLLLAVVMGRLITVAGDLGFFGITSMLKIK